MPGSSVELSRRELDVLAVLAAHEGRVVGRNELRNEAGLGDLSLRRCEAALVRLRRVLGPDAIVTVRRRGWMLAGHCRARAAELMTGSR